jgi:hypothetical protein
MGKSNDAIHIRSSADRVGRNGESHHPRALREQALEVLVVDFEITGESRHADDRAQVMSDLQPRSDVRVVIELRDDDLVARTQRPREGAREQEIECGHARPERDLRG